MKATLALEYIGEGQDAFCRLGRQIGRAAGFGDFLRAPSRRPWVARITGWDARFGYLRAFLPNNRNYRDASSTGNRGITLWYILESGAIYEVCHFTSWKSKSRYFCTVGAADGKIQRLTAQEVDQWLNAG